MQSVDRVFQNAGYAPRKSFLANLKILAVLYNSFTLELPKHLFPRIVFSFRFQADPPGPGRQCYLLFWV